MVNGTGVALLVLSGAAEAAYQWNLPTPVTRIGSEIYNLHLIMMGIILVIFIGVFGVMFYSIYAHRKSLGHKAEHFHENIAVEILWAVIPFLILIAVAWPAIKSILNLKDTAGPGVTIKVTGYQWKWGYDYLKGEGEGISFLSKPPQSRENYGELIEPQAISVWLLSDAVNPDAALLGDYPGLHVALASGGRIAAESPAARSPADHIYLVDPLGNLMLRFPADPDPRRMMKDLARLLRASRVG